MTIEKRHLLNYSIVIPYAILCVLGLIVVYSTTSPLMIQKGFAPFALVKNQTQFLGVSLIAITFMYRLKLNFLRNGRLLRLVMGAEVLLLLYARFFTETVNGAHGWIDVFGLTTFQPAEYLKILIVWYMAYTFSELQDQIRVNDYRALTHSTLFPHQLSDWRTFLLLLIGLVVIQPDLGNATIITLTAVLMYSISGISYRWFSFLLTMITVGSAFFLGTISLIGVETVAKVPVFGYVAKRFSAFFNPFNDLTDSGHQLANSYYAMSNGGWFGLGLGNSIEKRGYLPEAHTDFVFSIVIEEFGLVGAGIILAVVMFLILRIIAVGLKARTSFNSLMAIGIGAMMLVQVFVNIGGISGLIPSTGVTFPFLSQGGNSLLILSVGIAIVLNIDANEKRQAIQEDIARLQQENHYSEL